MRFVFASMLLAATTAAQEGAAPAPAADQHLDLRVLYAGKPDDARTAAWREFLQPRTNGFAVIDVEQLTEQSMGDADVLILDCPDPIVRNAEGKAERISVPRPKSLTAAFDRPTVVIGGMAMITDRLDLKLDWL